MAIKVLLNFFVALGLLCQYGKAQSLVPNGDFEQAYKNPCRFISDSRENIGQFFSNWSTPTKGTSDPWFTSDTVNEQCTQNLRQIGLTARSGIRCVGIYMSANNARFIKNSPNYREYIQTGLKRPLQKGKTYSVELYCRRHPWSGTNSNNLGFFFSTKPVATANDSVLRYKPQININEIIEADNAWVKLGGCFVADSNYTYLTIGNFFDEDNTRMLVAPLPNRDERPYYLLDDVSVVETPVENLPKPRFLRADTTLCAQQFLTIRLPQAPGVTYKWADGSRNLDYTISQPGSYSVTAQIDQCVVKDTITIQIEQPLRLPADTTLCADTPLTIRPSRSGGGLIWSDGSTDTTLTVRQSGFYSVRIPSAYCVLADTIQVRFLRCNPFVPNVFTPNGDGKNDFFVVDADNEQGLAWDLQIVNRWGGMVYEARPYKNDWDGGGLPAGVYYYLLTNSQYKRHFKGWVTLYR